MTAITLSKLNSQWQKIKTAMYIQNNFSPGFGDSGVQEHTASSLECPGLGVCLLIERCSYFFKTREKNYCAKVAYIPYRI